MSIEGLMVPQSAPETETNLFKLGTPDVTEAVGVTLELYAELGFAGDADKATEDLTRDFSALTELGYDGRLFVPAPAAISFGALLKVVEGKRPDGVSVAYVYAPFWTPGSEAESVSQANLDAAPSEALARIALFNADTETGVDPLLHHLDLPFDDYAKDKWGGDKTQTQVIEEDIDTFGAQHAGFSLNDMNHRHETVLAGMDRIRGIDPNSEAFILNNGWMRISDLGRRTVDGLSIVGDVRSVDGRLVFDGGFVSASSLDGVGFSAGQMSVEA